MDGVDVNILRLKVERILGPLFMRPLRTREITDELTDHALEAAEAGEADPVAALGGAKMLRRSIGRSFLPETALFLVSFIAAYASWRMLTDGLMQTVGSFLWIVPSDSFTQSIVKLNLFNFMMFIVFVTPFLIIAIALKRWHFLTQGRPWLRWSTFLLIVVLLHYFLSVLFGFGLCTLIQLIDSNLTSLGPDRILQNTWGIIIKGLTPWKYGPTEQSINIFVSLLIPAGILAYASRRIPAWAKGSILLLTLVFDQRSDLFYFLDGPKWLHYSWYYLCNGIRCFGLGFWIMFYLNIWDHLWNWFGRMHRDKQEMDLAGE